MDKFKTSYDISLFETDSGGTATPLSLLKILGESSGEHSETLGCGIESLMSLNYAWMLNRWRVKIYKYPKAKEKISIKTWTSKVDRFYANREFSFYNKEGELLGKASTLWIFIDMLKKRPIRIPEDVIKHYRLIPEQNFTDFYDFKLPYEIEDFQEFRIRRQDIDYNNHVNNSVYLSWMIENIPLDIYKNYKLSEFEIIYKKEAKYGNYIKIGSKELKNEDNSVEYISSIKSLENNEVHAEILSKWIKES